MADVGALVKGHFQDELRSFFEDRDKTMPLDAPTLSPSGSNVHPLYGDIRDAPPASSRRTSMALKVPTLSPSGSNVHP
eukprot:14102478-Heterocapsa_arctica.AAC.1